MADFPLQTNATLTLLIVHESNPLVKSDELEIHRHIRASVVQNVSIYKNY